MHGFPVSVDAPASRRQARAANRFYRQCASPVHGNGSIVMIVIPMAGNSRRFTEAGYDRPKFMLMLSGESLFAHSVRSFERYFAEEEFLFIAREDFSAGPFIA